MTSRHSWLLRSTRSSTEEGSGYSRHLAGMVRFSVNHLPSSNSFAVTNKGEVQLDYQWNFEPVEKPKSVNLAEPLESGPGLPRVLGDNQWTNEQVFPLPLWVTPQHRSRHVAHR